MHGRKLGEKWRIWKKIHILGIQTSFIVGDNLKKITQTIFKKWLYSMNSLSSSSQLIWLINSIPTYNVLLQGSWKEFEKDLRTWLLRTSYNKTDKILKNASLSLKSVSFEVLKRTGFKISKLLELLNNWIEMWFSKNDVDYLNAKYTKILMPSKWKPEPYEIKINNQAINTRCFGIIDALLKYSMQKGI